MQSVIRKALYLLILVVAGVFPAAADDLAKARAAYASQQPLEAIRLLKPLAEKGNADAQTLLGEIHEMADGRFGISADLKQARYWYDRAVEQDHTPAYRRLGRMLVRDFIDSAEGQRLLEIAAKRGDAEAQAMLGLYLMYPSFKLRGGRAAAHVWLLKSAEQKYAVGADHLAMWYRDKPGGALKSHMWEYIAFYLHGGYGEQFKPLMLPDIRKRLTKKQIAEAERQARDWLQARGVKAK